MKRKRTYLLLFLVLLVTTTGCFNKKEKPENDNKEKETEKEKDQKLKDYKEYTKNGITISYPKNFAEPTENTSIALENILVLFPDERTNISILVEELSNNYTVDSYLEASIEGIKQQLELKEADITISKTNINNKDTRIITYDYLGTPIYQAMYLPSDNKALVFTFASAPENEDNFEEIRDNIYSSIKYK